MTVSRVIVVRITFFSLGFNFFISLNVSYGQQWCHDTQGDGIAHNYTLYNNSQHCNTLHNYNIPNVPQYNELSSDIYK